MNPAVTEYISKLPAWQIEICDKLRAIIFNVIPDAEERIQYGKPHYLKNGHYAAVIQASKAKVAFTLFNALELPEQKGFFESTTAPERKTATISEGKAVDYQQLKELLQQASTTL